MRFIAVLALSITFVGVSLAHGADDAVGLRIRFGMKDADGVDWSGKITPATGKVTSIRGWRWMPGDHADGNAFTVATRRAVAQSREERQRVRAGGTLAVSDNGIIVSLSGVQADSEITFEAGPGKHTFKLADLPYGKRMMALGGNLSIERCPVAGEVAATMEDEDYPAMARAKDGTIYLTYLAFTRGKDFLGARERPTTPESGPVSGPLAVGDVKKIEKPEDFDYLAEPAGGEQVFLRISKDGSTWSDPIAVTDGKNELYRPAIAVDGEGKVWVFYSAHLDADKNLDYGNWDLMARRFDADGKNAAEPINLSNAAGVDFMPAAATDSEGKVSVTWVGGREKNFNVFVASQDDGKFGTPQRLTESKANEWEPAIAADANGHLAVAWDTYAKGDYDVQLSRRGKDGKFEPAQDVAATLAFEVRPSLSYDAKGRLWIAYEVSGDQWGKDWGALKRGVPVYQMGRELGVKVVDANGKWFTPASDVMADAMPIVGAKRPSELGGPAGGAKARQPSGAAGGIAPCYPRLSTAADGSVYLSFRGRPNGNWRVNVGSVWCEYVARLDSSGWNMAAWVPRSSNVLDNRPAVLAGGDGLTLVYSGDGRGEMNPAKIPDPHLQGQSDADAPNYDDVIPPEAYALAAAPAVDDESPATTQPDESGAAAGGRRGGRGGGGGRRRNLEPLNQDLFVTHVHASDFSSSSAGEIALKPHDAEKPATPSPLTESERNAVAAMRDFTVDLNGEKLHLFRGEFHRHTEFSPDGGGDGGLLDLWRYAIDAADLDWIGDGDHDYGNGREYSWWTTQKCVTLFTLPQRFVPMYCYERSVSYPEGHRNCLFAQRGVRSLPRLPISDPNVEKPAPDTNMLYMYLKRFNAVCAPHTSATDMGTDWRNHDPEVEPFVEIFQGDRNSYERPDAPRSAVTEAKLKQSTPEKESIGGWEPKGFVNLALLKGYRFAFESSSDHVSTHLSYCNVYVTEPTRQGILDAIKKRRVYGATDNLIADVRCKAGDGKDHFMGEEFSTSTAPTLRVHLIGPQKFTKVVIIKDDEEVHSIEPGEADVKFEWTDPKPSTGKTSYYYVRGEQAPDMDGITSGELVWASPLWIKVEAK